jgi:GNAT superfamily N-acetyltransferase
VPFSDLALARRLEGAEAHACVKFVEARARVFPRSGAGWIEVAGAHAVYDGVSSPITQTFGLGVFQAASSADLERIESFFKQRGAPVFHEVSPLAGLSLAASLCERGYRPIEFTSVLYLPLRNEIESPPAGNRIHTRLVGREEQQMWARTAAKGWSETPGISEFLQDLGAISAEREDAFSFLAELNGQPIAAGALSISSGVALLAGASTIPAGRKQGAQLALLHGRLRYAAEHGCDIAMLCAEPGSASQRNGERHGFRIAYTRVKWQLGLTAPA